MQFQNLLVATALAATASATPLYGRQASYGNGQSPSYSKPEASFVPHVSSVPTATRPAAVSSFPHASGVSSLPPSGSYVPPRPFNDGYGEVSPGNFSLTFCPVEHTVTVSRWLGDGPKHEKYTLTCPNNGASYEDVKSDLLPSFETLKIHGGNLCTSNTAQYYLWPSRMYENLWLAYGYQAVDTSASTECKLVNGGEVSRCVLPAVPVNNSPSRPLEPVPSYVSGVPHRVSGIPSRVSEYPQRVSEFPHASAIPTHVPAASYSQAPTYY